MTFDVEAEAQRLLERAGFGLDDVPGARLLVTRILGAHTLRAIAPRYLHGAEGEVCRVRGEWRIYLSDTLAPARGSFVALHELAHVHLGVAECGSEIEDACDRIAAALLCPARAFEAAVCEHGRRWRALASDFGCEPACAVLRYGEVTRAPLALVSPTSIRIRGDAWGWPAGPTLRKAKPPQGCRRERVPGGGSRAVLLATA